MHDQGHQESSNLGAEPVGQHGKSASDQYDQRGAQALASAARDGLSLGSGQSVYLRGSHDAGRLAGLAAELFPSRMSRRQRLARELLLDPQKGGGSSRAFSYPGAGAPSSVRFHRAILQPKEDSEIPWLSFPYGCPDPTRPGGRLTTA